MDIWIIFETVSSLFLLIVVGFIISKLNILTEETSKKLAGLLLNVTVPVLIIMSFLGMEKDPEVLINGFIIIGLATLVHLLNFVISFLLYRRVEDKRRAVMRFGIIFANSGFMGIPVMKALLGDLGVLYTAFYIIVFNTFIFTLGVALYHQSNDRKQIFKQMINPGSISVVIGLILYLIDFNMPSVIDSSMRMLGDMTTPLSLLIIGGLLSHVHLKEMITDISVYTISFIRLLLIPVFVFLIISLLPIDQNVVLVVYVLAGMPVAANTVLFAERYDGDATYASKIIGISTFLSIFTIPLILLFSM
jgi:predicted permease